MPSPTLNYLNQRYRSKGVRWYELPENLDFWKSESAINMSCLCVRRPLVPIHLLLCGGDKMGKWNGNFPALDCWLQLNVILGMAADD